MDTKISLERGRTFLLAGEWGYDFLPDTVLTCKLVSKDLEVPLTVTKTGERAFQIYASNTTTAALAKGAYSAVLDRVDPNYFPNGDPYVRGPETFTVEVT